jgi:hypothetical protein
MRLAFTRARVPAHLQAQAELNDLCVSFGRGAKNSWSLRHAACAREETLGATVDGFSESQVLPHCGSSG